MVIDNMGKTLVWVFSTLFLLGTPVWAALYAGASRTVINPEVSPESHLEINALVLENGGERVVFCSIDTGALDQKLVAAVIDSLRASGTGISWDQMMLSATHTHTGAYAGLMEGAIQEMAFGAFNPATLAAAVEAVSQTIMAAAFSVVPARVAFGTAETPELARNRSYAGGFIDPTLSVLYVDTTESAPIAYLVNYAAHPTILSHGSGIKSDKALKGRDFPYGLSLALREYAATPDLPVLFINGNLGNVAPRPPGGTTRFEQAELTGRALAAHALAALAPATADSHAPISRYASVAPLPVSLLAHVGPAEAVLHEFRVGEAVFLSLPGEVCSQPGWALRQKALDSGASHVFLCGLTNNYLGYHPDAAEWFGALYESEMSFYGPMLDRWLLENYLLETPAPPPNVYSLLLREQWNAYLLGRQEGSARVAAIQRRWEAESGRLEALAPMAPSLVDLPPNVQAMLNSLPEEDVAQIGKQYAAYFARQQFLPLHTDAHRAKLIGIADGAELPVDAIMLLQFIKELPGVPPEYIPLLRTMGFSGMDFFTPTADFTAFPTSGVAPLSVQFANLSGYGLGPVVRVLWDFGDGFQSSQQNPLHVYTVPGDYTVTLTLEIGEGKNIYVKTITSFIKVEPVIPATTAFSLTIALMGITAAGGCVLIRRTRSQDGHGQ